MYTYPYYSPMNGAMPDNLSQLRSQQMPSPPQNNNNGLIWVQGESGAKSFPVMPNSNVLLMDSEAQRFFIKSADASGMPMPLRVFNYTEVKVGTANENTTNTLDMSQYVTRDELAKIIEGLNITEVKGEAKDGK